MKQHPVPTASNAGPIDILWGIAAIASAIQRTPRQTHYLLSLDALPAKKVGGHWCANRRDLEAFFTAAVRAEAA